MADRGLMRAVKARLNLTERGQAAMVVIAVLLTVLTVIPAVVFNQVIDQAPVMSRSELALQAEMAARSGISNFEYYLEDPRYSLSKDPALVSSLPTQSVCESSTSRVNWETVTVGTTSGGISSAFEYYLVKKSGSEYLFSLGRAGVPGHYVCRELKAAFLNSGKG